MAALVALKSKDPSTQSGCVLVGPDHEVRSTGYNGLPRGVDDNNPDRNERPIKYKWYAHAELNAITNAARCGIATKGCTAYVNWHPCARCTAALIQAGVCRIVYYEIPNDEAGAALRKRWAEDMAIGDEMMAEAKIISCQI